MSHHLHHILLTGAKSQVLSTLKERHLHDGTGEEGVVGSHLKFCLHRIMFEIALVFLQHPFQLPPPGVSLIGPKITLAMICLGESM